MNNSKTVMGTTLCPPSLYYVTKEEFLNSAKIKRYLHIDRKISPAKAYTYISKPSNIQRHAFYPLLHYDDKSAKIRKIKNEKTKKSTYIFKKKIRPLYYAGHMDQLIFKYYGDSLNKLYNIRAEKIGIQNVVTAYRSGISTHKGKNNIHFAFDAFKFLLQSPSATILLIDFKSFFDNIDHHSLKLEIIETLKCSDPSLNELPNDWYNVFKNLTNFSYINKQAIHKYVSEKKQLSVSNISSSTAYFENVKEYRGFKKSSPNLVKDERKNFGIPQGTAMSAVCANVRMAPADLALLELAKIHNGFYRRYSDDIIFIIPEIYNNSQADTVENQIYQAISKFSDLKLEKDKTMTYRWRNNEILEINPKNQAKPAKSFDYLGFNFDGRHIKIKSASISRYYSKMHRMAKGLGRLKKRYPQKFVNLRDFYEKFSKLNEQNKTNLTKFHHKKSKFKYNGNFITYANKSYQIMKDLEAFGISITIKKDIDRHWYKLQKLKTKYLSYCSEVKSR